MCYQPITLKDGTGRQYSCGKCEQCHKRYIQHWVFRLKNQLSVDVKGVFLTFTYDYDNIPITDKGKFTLYKKDYQDFFKRLRKLYSFPLKYVVCGEYGGKLGRPHYHAIIFGLDVNDFNNINKSWGKGSIHVGSVTGASIAYVFKYSVKKCLTKLHYSCVKPFVAMSKGLGENFAFDVKRSKPRLVECTYKKGEKKGQKYYQKRTSKIRIPKQHFERKLQGLTKMPYYILPRDGGGTVKMSMPRFYLRAAHYDTTELTDIYLQKKHDDFQRLPLPYRQQYFDNREKKVEQIAKIFVKNLQNNEKQLSL